MSIPLFNRSGVIPPFIGDDAGTVKEAQSPYKTTMLEVVEVLGFSAGRLDLIEKLIEFRRELRSLGLNAGRQWIDGSFVEMKEPNDIDVITMYESREVSADYDEAVNQLAPLLTRKRLKELYSLDAISVDMSGKSGAVLDAIGFYLPLFSHRRSDFAWKGILSISLDSEQSDASALELIERRRAASVAP